MVLCMRKAWLFLTDLHGMLRGKLIPLSKEDDGGDDGGDDMDECKTEFSGVFVGDVFDRFIPEVKTVERRVIVAVPRSNGIQSPWDVSETYYICNGYADEK